jgi:hypothetical protein
MIVPKRDAMVLLDATSADANGSLICCVSGTLPFR